MTSTDTATPTTLTDGATVTVTHGFYRGATGTIEFRAMTGEYAVLFPGYVRPVNFPATMLDAAGVPA